MGLFRLDRMQQFEHFDIDSTTIWAQAKKDVISVCGQWWQFQRFVNISKKNLGKIKKCIEMLIRSLREFRENQENLDRTMYINKSKQVDKSTACFGLVKNTVLEEVHPLTWFPRSDFVSWLALQCKLFGCTYSHTPFLCRVGLWAQGYGSIMALPTGLLTPSMNVHSRGSLAKFERVFLIISVPCWHEVTCSWMTGQRIASQWKGKVSEELANLC